MAIERLKYDQFIDMIKQGATQLANNVKIVDALNVFPVPDGDTGTNMNLTMTSGVKQLQQVHSTHIGQVASAFAKGLLMGARGNSGVILSQLFRGFAKSIESYEDITVEQFALALESGVNTAYKAVMKPVEGTILTVAKDTAVHGIKKAKTSKDMVSFMEIVVQEATKSLQRTPDLLPVLKEVGVVDSGGQGLVLIYQGFLSGLTGEVYKGEAIDSKPSMEDLVNAEHHIHAQSYLKTDDITYGYCTEFMVKFNNDKSYDFDEEVFRDELAERGDSLLVVSDDNLIKVHVHTEEPGHMLSLGQQFGDLTNIKIENMREQHTNIIKDEPAEKIKKQIEKIGNGIITVAIGQGVQELFKSIGAHYIIEGGQTMNPSTEDIVKAIHDVHAEHVFILPNNSNIVMAAKQAAEVADCQVTVIPTKTIPQGIAALLSFNPEGTIDTNTSSMSLASERVKSGQVTFAVRDTMVDGVSIKKDDYLGIADGKIVTSQSDRQRALMVLVREMIDSDDGIVTIIYGEDVERNEVDLIVSSIEEEYHDIEVEIHEGNQPIYTYIISVE